jgi:antitoxin MazE
MPQMTRKCKIAKWGNSLAVRIPQEAAQRMGLREGSEVSVAVRDDSMTIRQTRRITSLEALLQNVTPQKAGGEIDSGPPVGREAW